MPTTPTASRDPSPRRLRDRKREDAAGHERHKRLWFVDGDIIIVAGNILHRVHKNILTDSSTVLSTKIAASHGEVIEGQPTLPLDDHPIDVEYMLYSIYDASLLNTKKLEFDCVSAFLRLGQKYDIALLRTKAVERLTAFWPNTLKKYDEGRACTTRVINLNYNDVYAEEFVVAQFALMYNIAPLLPVVLYGCCIWTDDKLPSALERTQEKYGRTVTGTIPSQELFLTVNRGSRALIKLRASVLFSFLVDGELSDTCTSEDKCNTVLHKALDEADKLELRTDIRALEDCVESFIEPNTKDACENCRRHWIARHQRAREEIWARLPSCFGLALSEEEWPAME